MVYLFLADGFEEIEGLTAVDLLRRAGVTVTTVGVTGKQVTGSHGIPVTADVTAKEAEKMLAKETKLEMVVLPGGMPGTKYLGASETVKRFLAEAMAKDAFVAAICAAPSVLGQYGLVDGKSATCYPGFEKMMPGANMLNRPVVRDGKFITGQAMGAATEFALALVGALCGEKKAEEIRASILYNV